MVRVDARALCAATRESIVDVGNEFGLLMKSSMHVRMTDDRPIVDGPKRSKVPDPTYLIRFEQITCWPDFVSSCFSVSYVSFA